MSPTPLTLLEALAATDMLEIDGLHTWQFALDPEAQEQTAEQLGAPLTRDQHFLSIECMDGRRRREWHFSHAQVLAATFCADSESWLITDAREQYQLKCLNGIVADDSNDSATDEPDAAPQG